jgi:hypothetical protein
MEGKPITFMDTSPKSKIVQDNEEKKKKKKEIVITGWLILLTVSTYILGFMVAIPLFIFFFIKFQAKKGWLLSLCFSVIIVFVIYAVFVYFLKIPLHEGIII